MAKQRRPADRGVTSEPIHDVRLLFDQRVPMRDGATLSAHVVLPRGRGTFPALVFRTPYESNSERYLQWALWWAKRGYAAIAQNCRGRYQSEGTFYAYRDD